ncbi:unnamed protein product [Sphagnum tenellum]
MNREQTMLHFIQNPSIQRAKTSMEALVTRMNALTKETNTGMIQRTPEWATTTKAVQLNIEQLLMYLRANRPGAPDLAEPKIHIPTTRSNRKTCLRTRIKEDKKFGICIKPLLQPGDCMDMRLTTADGATVKYCRNEGKRHHQFIPGKQFLEVETAENMYTRFYYTDSRGHRRVRIIALASVGQVTASISCPGELSTPDEHLWFIHARAYTQSQTAYDIVPLEIIKRSTQYANTRAFKSRVMDGLKSEDPIRSLEDALNDYIEHVKVRQEETGEGQDMEYKNMTKQILVPQMRTGTGGARFLLPQLNIRRITPPGAATSTAIEVSETVISGPTATAVVAPTIQPPPRPITTDPASTQLPTPPPVTQAPPVTPPMASEPSERGIPPKKRQRYSIVTEMEPVATTMGMATSSITSTLTWSMSSQQEEPTTMTASSGTINIPSSGTINIPIRMTAQRLPPVTFIPLRIPSPQQAINETVVTQNYEEFLSGMSSVQRQTTQPSNTTPIPNVEVKAVSGAIRRQRIIEHIAEDTEESYQDTFDIDDELFRPPTPFATDYSDDSSCELLYSDYAADTNELNRDDGVEDMANKMNERIPRQHRDIIPHNRRDVCKTTAEAEDAIRIYENTNQAEMRRLQSTMTTEAFVTILKTRTALTKKQTTFHASTLRYQKAKAAVIAAPRLKGLRERAIQASHEFEYIQHLIRANIKLQPKPKQERLRQIFDPPQHLFTGLEEDQALALAENKAARKATPFDTPTIAELRIMDKQPGVARLKTLIGAAFGYLI